jgi:hypothetical protein
VQRASLFLLLPAALLAAGCSREGQAAPSITSSAPVAAAPASSPAPAVPASASPADAGAAPAPTVIATAAAPPASAPPDAGARSPDECPPEMAKLGRLCIDRWEAHLVTRSANGDLTPLPFFARPPEDGAYEARSAAGAYPQAYISRVEAANACRNAGKRLCTMGEWQRACSGKRGGHYPYGQDWKADRCNMDKPHLLSIRFGPSSKKWTYEAFNDPTLNQEPGFLAPAGSYDQCTSDNGTYDMVGNLHEWVSDTVDEDFVARMEAEPVERKHQGWKEGNGVFMGGFFSTHEQLGPGCKYVTYAHEPSYHDYSTGFRCCATLPPPAKASKKR